jgi:hypothetical protein
MAMSCGKRRMKSIEKSDISMFSGQENWTRHPPEARSVEQCS